MRAVGALIRYFMASFLVGSQRIRRKLLLRPGGRSAIRGYSTENMSKCKHQSIQFALMSSVSATVDG